MADVPRKILIQLDSDKHASVFDRVVAIDAGVDELFAYGSVSEDDVQGMVHGAIFTRGGDNLKNTAIFIGGSDVAKGETLLKKVSGTFFGPMRVSVMLDANGANTTAAAAVLCASKHLKLEGCNALVLGGTGPVGQRAARLLARQGANVSLASRSLERASKAATEINVALNPDEATTHRPRVKPVAVSDDASLIDALAGQSLVIAAGAAGVCLLPQLIRLNSHDLKVAIDLNAVPPAGIEGVDVIAKAKEQQSQIVYGAIGVGGLKMKIHKAAIAKLFETNDQVLDAESIYEIGEGLLSS